jgi:hypothetical protein
MQPMTDERLDRLIRELLTERAEDVAAGAVSAEAMVERIATRRPIAFARGWVLLAAAAMLAALLIGGALAVGGAIRLPSLLLPAPLPSPALDRQSMAPEPSPAPDSERVHRWPDTTENEPGLYSWNGSPCGMSCNNGFMHNGYGSGDVEIRIEIVPEESVASDGGNAVTIAGHDAIHRRIDERQEVWIVEIEGTTISIHLTTEPGTSQADLAEAYAIIDSMRTESQDNDLGFRLVFRLATDNWDSG